MTKLCKKSFIVILALCIAACLMSFVACGDDTEDTSVTYSVTVYTDNDTPASGVDVTIKKGSAEFDTKATNANGKVEFRLAPDSYTVELDALPDHYELANNANLELTAQNRDLVVNLQRKLAYTVKLVNPDNTAYTYNGAKVLCCTDDGNCKTPVALGTDGIAVIETTRDDYHVKVEGLPDTVAYESDNNCYYTGEEFTTANGKTEMTIKVYPVTAVTSLTPMTNEEKIEYANNNWAYSPSDTTAYHVKKTLAPDETVYYSLTPEFDSKFNLYKEGIASYLTNGKGFQLGNKGLMLNDFDVMKADTTYHFNVTNMNSEDVEIEFVVECPTASHHVVTTLAKLNVTIKDESAHAIVEYTPSATGAYKLKAEGTQLTSIVYATSLYYAQSADHDEESFVQGAEASAKVTQKELGTKILYFSIAVKDVDTPVSFNVSLEKVGTVEDDKTVIKHTEETLAPFNNVADKALAYVPVDGTAVLVYNNTDKFYHLNTADGPIVVVKLTKPINDDDRFFPGVDVPAALTELDKAFNESGSEGTFMPYIMDTTTAADLADLTKGYTSTDFRVMLRGFTEYNVEVVDGESVYVAPTISEPSYYGKNVNSDGVYPLTKELEEFLKLFAKNHDFNMPRDAAEGCAWLFACYYYDDPVTDLDVIVGTYELVSFTVKEDGVEKTYNLGDNMKLGPWDEEGTEIKKNSLTLTVANVGTVSNKTFRITDSLTWNDFQYSGKWSKSDEGVYTFTATGALWDDDSSSYKDLPFTVSFNAETGAITLSYVKDEDNSRSFSFIKATEDEIMGEYEFVSITEGETTKVIGDTYRVMMQEREIDADYITLSVTNAEFEMSGNSDYSYYGEWENDEDSYTFTVPYASYDDEGEMCDLVITAEYDSETEKLTLSFTKVSVEEGDEGEDPSIVKTNVTIILQKAAA